MEQLIKLTGRILKVLPMQSGVSQRTGNEWKSQEYVLEYFMWSGSRYPNSVVGRVFGEDDIAKFNLKEGEDNVTLTLSPTANPSKDGTRYFQEMRITNVERAAGAQPATEPVQQANTTATGSNTTQQTNGAQAAPFPPAVDANGNPTNQEAAKNDDDLPF